VIEIRQFFLLQAVILVMNDDKLLM